MADPFIAEIRIFAGSFAPRGWTFCDGQLLQIAQNTALFSLVGTTYGGDGRTTFGVPNLKGRFPMHAGRGPGLTPRNLGQGGGSETVGLNANQIPAHTHTWRASGEDAEGDDPQGNYVAVVRDASFSDVGGVTMAADQIQSTGSASPTAHNNVQPYLALYFIIALIGTFPSRS